MQRYSLNCSSRNCIQYDVYFIVCEDLYLSDEEYEPLRVSTTGTGVGDTATYTCDCGYKVVGDRIRTCESSGSWSGSQPTCEG